MTDDIARSQIKAIEELLDKNLKIVQKALGIESAIGVEELPEQGSKESQLELKLELINQEVRRNVIDNKNSQERLAERKHYLAAKKIELQAVFAASRAKFVARQQAKKYSHHL